MVYLNYLGWLKLDKKFAFVGEGTLIFFHFKRNTVPASKGEESREFMNIVTRFIANQNQQIWKGS